MSHIRKLLVFLSIVLLSAGVAADDRPNILWLTAEDIGPHIGAYGDGYAYTPNIDRFARTALRYDVAWSNNPVCSPARTAIISGMHPNSFGGHNHRSQIGIPDPLRQYPQLLRELGYYCTNNVKLGHNVYDDGNVWDESSDTAHWRNRAEGQPFFAIFNSTLSHGGQIRNRTELPHHDPALAPLPPYHPDTPEFRRDWAQYYHSIYLMDRWFGEMLKELEEDGLLDDTVVFFYGDHGSGMPRNKQLAYDSGLLVPFIVHIPEKYRHLAPAEYRPGGATRRMVDFVDLAPTLLSLAGAQAPDWMHGRAFMGKHEGAPHDYLFGFRGRMDERQDIVRSVRNDRYMYIRNYTPHLKHGHFSHYMYTLESTRSWRREFEAGRLNAAQSHVWVEKPAEELYDLHADPHEVNNLANCAEHREVLNEMRAALWDHIVRIRDVAFLPEAEMHRRAKGTSAPSWELGPGNTIYEMAQDPNRYPLEPIMAMAELAADRSFSAVPQLRVGLRDKDPAVRYWATMGLLIRGAAAVEQAKEGLRRVLDDENPSVRIIAARTLGEFGNERDRQNALSVLKNLAPPARNGAYVSIEAVTAINDLGDRSRELHAWLDEMDAEDPRAPWIGANEFIIRLRPSFIHPSLLE